MNHNNSNNNNNNNATLMSNVKFSNKFKDCRHSHAATGRVVNCCERCYNAQKVIDMMLEKKDMESDFASELSQFVRANVEGAMFVVTDEQHLNNIKEFVEQAHKNNIIEIEDDYINFAENDLTVPDRKTMGHVVLDFPCIPACFKMEITCEHYDQLCSFGLDRTEYKHDDSCTMIENICAMMLEQFHQTKLSGDCLVLKVVHTLPVEAHRMINGVNINMINILLENLLKEMNEVQFMKPLKKRMYKVQKELTVVKALMPQVQDTKLKLTSRRYRPIQGAGDDWSGIENHVLY